MAPSNWSSWNPDRTWEKLRPNIQRTWPKRWLVQQFLGGRNLRGLEWFSLKMTKFIWAWSRIGSTWPISSKDMLGSFLREVFFDPCSLIEGAGVYDWDDGRTHQEKSEFSRFSFRWKETSDEEKSFEVPQVNRDGSDIKFLQAWLSTCWYIGFSLKARCRCCC